MVTHGISHLHKCDDIIVISQGEIADQGPYNDLMNRSKILRELVHSIAASDKEKYQTQLSDLGKCEKYVFNEYKSRSSWFILEDQKSAPASPAELFQNPLEITENKDEPQPLPIEIGEEKKKLIQKETVQTGSVSSTD